MSRIFKRVLSRPPHLVAWKLWEKARRRRDRRIDWQSGVESIRWSRARLERELGSRFFAGSDELDRTALSLEAGDTHWKAQLESRAAQIIERRFVILGAGLTILDQKVRWSKDYRSGLSWDEGRYCFDYDILDFARSTDVRVVWELGRLHELVVLGKAYRATKHVAYFRGFRELVVSWLENNPVGWSVNWSCAMEASIRAMNLIWAIALFLPCEELDDEFLTRVISSVAVHGRFVRRNLEWNDLRNNHYLADLAGLLVIATFLPELPESRRWIRFAASRLEREAQLQIHPDGVDYEGSIPYQQLVTEIYLTSLAILQKRGDDFSEMTLGRMDRMLSFIAAYTKPNGRAPVIGDNDDGRLVVLGPQPRSDHRHLMSTGGVLLNKPELVARGGGMAEETCWLLGDRALQFRSAGPEVPGESAEFPHGGVYVMRSGDTHAVIDAGEVGMRGRGAHGHHDALSFELVLRGDELVIDTGCASYTADRAERIRTVSAAAHNVPVIDSRDSAKMDSWAFVQAGPTEVRVLSWVTSDRQDELVAEHFGFSPIVVRRRLSLNKIDHRFVVQDEVSGEGRHQIRVAFHLHPSCRAELCDDGIGLTVNQNHYRMRVESEGRWSTEPALVYLEYALARESTRVVFDLTAQLPQSLRFTIEPAS